MAVEDIFAPQSIDGEDQTNAYADRVIAHIDACDIKPHESHAYIYSRALRKASAAIRTGARGVGCVITKMRSDLGQHEFIAEGENRLADEDFDFAHVAHAEVLTIAEMRKANRLIRESGHGEEHRSQDTTLWSTLGPCAMCMCASINQRIGNVVTIAPDWTGGVTMEHIAKQYPGYRKYIEKFGLQSFDAPVDLVEKPKIAQEMRLLCWAVSRIKEFQFDAEEFYANDDLVLHEPLDERTICVDDLQKRLDNQMTKCNLSIGHPLVLQILDMMRNAFGSLSGSEPLIPDQVDCLLNGQAEHWTQQSFKVTMVLTLINHLNRNVGDQSA